jgi:hypothetical protein
MRIKEQNEYDGVRIKCDAHLTELDKSYSAVKANCHPWSAESSGTKEDA